MDYNSITEFVVGFSINIAVVCIIFALLKKGTRDIIVYSLTFISSFCVYFFSIILTNPPSFMDELGHIIAIISLFFALFFGTMCYILCNKLFKGKFDS